MLSIRTSTTSPIRVDWLPLPGPGALGLTIAPGKQGPSLTGGFTWQRDLRLDLQRLRSVERADVLVNLLGDEELARLGIPDLPVHATSEGMEVLRLPIIDGHTPAAEAKVAPLIQRIIAGRAAGRRVVVHCAGGLGRAGTIAGCTLVEIGYSPEEALGLLVATRGKDCPETEAQRAFIRGWATR